MWQYTYSDELYHYGVKGQKWGVRRYQYTDGSLTPQGKKRYSSNSTQFSRMMDSKVTYVINSAKTQITGKQYVDGYLKKNTQFARIQSSDVFEDHAFYATYKTGDNARYLGLFGKNLQARADYEARKAEKLAKQTGDEADILNAKALRDKSDNMKVYQLKISSTKKLRVPSDENAADITAKLLREKDFKDNLTASIADSKAKMRRPSQQLLFKQAENALKKNVDKLTSSEKVAIYKAFNLSLTNHNPQEIAAQNRFYSEMKKKGYNALLDYNDKEFSSYQAKCPMIVFDVDSVKLQSVSETNPKIVELLYMRYNAERILSQIPANTVGVAAKYGTKTVSECDAYVRQMLQDYVRQK